MKAQVIAGQVIPLLFLWTGLSDAATYQVGPGQQYTTIPAAMAVAKAGDIVEVQGNQTYTGSFLFTSNVGTAGHPVTLRGIPVNGHRPLLRGVGPGQYDNMVVYLNANHFVMESFEVVGDGTATDYCIVHGADDVTLRDMVVHDCPHQAGLVGNDGNAGSLTLEYSEFFRNGTGDTSHQIYMATDEATYPHSVFRMQYCYVHDATGGNSVQSRAERNEIYYNWIEGAEYHELDLIGPDYGDPKLAREDSDVVGNVFIKTSQWRIARIGGDGSGDSAGRYRFANNTMVLGSLAGTAITLQQTVSTLEMYNNLIIHTGSGYQVYNVTEQLGPSAILFGSNNWVLTGTTAIPTPWTATGMGSDPSLVAASAYDYRPAPGSPLVDQGTPITATTGTYAFPNPLPLPHFDPPVRRLLPIGGAVARQITGAAPDIGAFEQTDNPPGAAPDPGSFASPSGTGTSGCQCQLTRDSRGLNGVPAAYLLIGLWLMRRYFSRRCRQVPANPSS